MLTCAAAMIATSPGRGLNATSMHSSAAESSFWLVLVWFRLIPCSTVGVTGDPPSWQPWFPLVKWLTTLSVMRRASMGCQAAAHALPAQQLGGGCVLTSDPIPTGAHAQAKSASVRQRRGAHRLLRFSPAWANCDSRCMKRGDAAFYMNAARKPASPPSVDGAAAPAASSGAHRLCPRYIG